MGQKWLSFVYFTEIKEKVLLYLEKEEFAFDKLDDLWRDKINTTGATTVRELFERYEKERGPLSTDDLEDLLRDLAFVHITCHVFPQMGCTSSTGKFWKKHMTVYPWFFEKQATQYMSVSCSDSGNLMPLLTGKVKSQLKKKFFNTGASI